MKKEIKITKTSGTRLVHVFRALQLYTYHKEGVMKPYMHFKEEFCEVCQRLDNEQRGTFFLRINKQNPMHQLGYMIHRSKIDDFDISDTDISKIMKYGDHITKIYKDIKQDYLKKTIDPLYFVFRKDKKQKE